MTGAAVALAGVLVAAALAAVSVVLHKGLAQVIEQLDQLRRHPPDIQRDLDQFWNELHRAQGERIEATDKRFRGIETALTQAQQTQDGLTKTVKWMLPWVQLWSEGDQR